MVGEFNAPGVILLFYPLILFKSILYATPCAIIYIFGSHFLLTTRLNAFSIKAAIIALSVALSYIVFTLALEERNATVNAYCMSSIISRVLIPIKTR